MPALPKLGLRTSGASAPPAFAGRGWPAAGIALQAGRFRSIFVFRYSSGDPLKAAARLAGGTPFWSQPRFW